MIKEDGDDKDNGYDNEADKEENENMQIREKPSV
jgi:hypothetical protein